MINSIEKNKIPKNLNFVLKTKQLEEIIINNDINIHIDLIYTNGIRPIFEVFYLKPNQNISYNRLYIRAGTVLKINVNKAREQMNEKILPEFIIWIKKITKLIDNNYNLPENIYFRAYYNDKNELIIKK